MWSMASRDVPPVGRATGVVASTLADGASHDSPSAEGGARRGFGVDGPVRPAEPRRTAPFRFTIRADAAHPAGPLRRERGRTHLLRRVVLGTAPHRPRPCLVAGCPGRVGARLGSTLRPHLERAEMVAAH